MSKPKCEVIRWVPDVHLKEITHTVSFAIPKADVEAALGRGLMRAPILGQDLAVTLDKEQSLRPKAGDRVRRLVHLKVTVDNQLCMRLGPITGRVLAVADDRHAFGGWVALVRWWNPSRQRHRWEAHHGLDFSAERGDITRVDIIQAKKLKPGG